MVWADEVETLIPSAEALEQRMISYVWSGRHQELTALEEEEKEEDDEEEGWVDRDAALEKRLEENQDRNMDKEERVLGAEEQAWPSIHKA